MDLGRWIAIAQSKTKGYAVLIRAADSGSGGEDGSDARGGGAETPTTFPAVARDEVRWTWPKLALRGSI